MREQRAGKTPCHTPKRKSPKKEKKKETAGTKKYSFYTSSRALDSRATS